MGGISLCKNIITIADRRLLSISLIKQIRAVFQFSQRSSFGHPIKRRPAASCIGCGGIFRFGYLYLKAHSAHTARLLGMPAIIISTAFTRTFFCRKQYRFRISIIRGWWGFGRLRAVCRFIGGIDLVAGGLYDVCGHVVHSTGDDLALFI